MTWQSGDKCIIRHKPGKAFAPDIIIHCTVVKIGTGPNDGKVKVDSENQKGIIVPIGYLEKEHED